jgi:DNA-binding HxlR family transcriptional regulator
MAARKGYGQFCPVAKAAEIFAERWTPLVLRELIVGSRRFNELRRGLPLMSSALLSQRLKELEYAGILEHRGGVRKNAEYHLTEAGQELRPVIEALGFWGARWMRSRVTSEDYDPRLLMWDIRRNIDVERLPGGQRTVIAIDLQGAEPALRRWWLVVDAGEVDLCLKDPGYEVNLHLSAELRAMVEVWTGSQSMGEAMRAGKLTFEGSRTLASSFRKCLKLSPFARAQAEITV